MAWAQKGPKISYNKWRFFYWRWKIDFDSRFKLFGSFFWFWNEFILGRVFLSPSGLCLFVFARQIVEWDERRKKRRSHTVSATLTLSICSLLLQHWIISVPLNFCPPSSKRQTKTTTKNRSISNQSIPSDALMKSRFNKQEPLVTPNL